MELKVRIEVETQLSLLQSILRVRKGEWTDLSNFINADELCDMGPYVSGFFLE
jgi:hypothetical protein